MAKDNASKYFDEMLIDDEKGVKKKKILTKDCNM